MARRATRRKTKKSTAARGRRRTKPATSAKLRRAASHRRRNRFGQFV